MFYSDSDWVSLVSTSLVSLLAFELELDNVLSFELEQYDKHCPAITYASLADRIIPAAIRMNMNFFILLPLFEHFHYG